MKRKIIFVILLFLVSSIGYVLYGCKDGSGNTDSSMEQESIDITSKTGKKDAEAFVEALKAKDNRALQSMLKNSYNYEIDEIDKIIFCFDNFYTLKSLQVEPIDSENSILEEYYFKIIGEKEGELHSTNLVIKYDVTDKGINTLYQHTFIQYFPYAEKTVDYYLKFLQKGDPGELSSFLSIDGGPDYYRAEAEELIRDYNDQYDMSSVTHEYIGFENNKFIFNMSDQKGKSREIHIVYGDGLVGVQEEILTK